MGGYTFCKSCLTKDLAGKMKPSCGLWEPIQCPVRDAAPRYKWCKYHNTYDLRPEEIEKNCPELLEKYKARKIQQAKMLKQNCYFTGEKKQEILQRLINREPERCKKDYNNFVAWIPTPGSLPKWCPMCYTFINKSRGCNTVTCPCCAYRFCWLCGKRAGAYKGERRDGYCNMLCQATR